MFVLVQFFLNLHFPHIFLLPRVQSSAGGLWVDGAVME